MILGLVKEAVETGARQSKACALLGLSARTLERGRRQAHGEDRRHGPKTAPANRLSCAERQQVLKVVNSPQPCDLSPKQIVPRLADEGLYIGSESTIYRILREADQMAHRQPSRPPRPRPRPREHVASGPGQVLSWDITYLRSPIRGSFFYLYMIVDVWSRKILGARVCAEESAEHAAEIFTQSCLAHRLEAQNLVLHADNGGPMKGSTMLATLHRLGVAASFSRPRVSDDNPYSEALFRTLKYRPGFPSGPFADLAAAQAWVDHFVRWYNTEHRHSALRFVTPEQRHAGRDATILAQRERVYEAAYQRHPERWSGCRRNWQPVGEVVLNPEKGKEQNEDVKKAA